MSGSPRSGSPRDPENSGEIYARRQIKEIAARWDARADSWDQTLEDSACHLNEDDAYRRFIRVVQRLIAQRRQFCATQGVIDVGCGTGLVLAKVISTFAWGIGVDISPQMIRVARAKHLANTTFLVGDCFRLPTLCPKAGSVLSRGVLLLALWPQGRPGSPQGRAIHSAARRFPVVRFFERSRARQTSPRARKQNLVHR